MAIFDLEISSQREGGGGGAALHIARQEHLHGYSIHINQTK